MTLPQRLLHHTFSQTEQLRINANYYLRAYKIALFAFIERYWFRLTVIGFFIGVLCLKEVHIQFNWQSPTHQSSMVATNLPPTETLNVLPLATAINTKKELTLKRKKQLEYVVRFAKVAQAEMKKYGIPASITLAQGLLETNAGESRLATKMNNHFGIKCFSKKCQKGHCANFSDDSHKDFFRRYNTAWESFRAHSQLLQSARYQSLYDLSPTDYVAWAEGLKKAGYATDKKYPEKLVHLIQELNLQQYDS